MSATWGFISEHLSESYYLEAIALFRSNPCGILVVLGACYKSRVCGGKAKGCFSCGGVRVILGEIG